MIPKIIYICDKNLNYIKNYTQIWKKLNPEYEIKLYDNAMCETFLQNEFSQLHCDIFKFIPDGPIKADFWRVCIIYKYGGLYVDADIEPFVPLNTYIEDTDEFVTCLSDFNNSSNPHFILANKDDPILKLAIDNYINLYNNKVKYNYWEWSIVKIFNFLLNLDTNELNIVKSGIYTINDKTFKFLKETPNNKTNRQYCVYNDVQVLSNRYLDWDRYNHTFTPLHILNASLHKKVSGNECKGNITRRIINAQMCNILPKHIADNSNKSKTTQFTQDVKGEHNSMRVFNNSFQSLNAYKNQFKPTVINNNNKWQNKNQFKPNNIDHHRNIIINQISKFVLSNHNQPGAMNQLPDKNSKDGKEKFDIHTLAKTVDKNVQKPKLVNATNKQQLFKTTLRFKQIKTMII